MKPKLFLIPALMAFYFLLAFRLSENNVALSPLEAFEQYKKKNIIRCSPDWNAVNEWIEELDIPPMPGSGKHHWKIDTKNDSAQFYFDQGINMYYGFHIIESMASFKKAAKFDPSSAMLQWAQALAYGPNINDLGYSASPDALTASRKAVELSGNVSEKEKMLIHAQSYRYSADSAMKRDKLNQLYVDKMKEAYEKFPEDADIAALYADALMLQHPWDLWKVDGTPKPWTPRIREVLERLLAKHPDHPGANHYYIHVMEPSPYANKALPSADRLGDLSPGLSHLVHMPSHIYLRTGNYARGAEVNEKAVASYKKYIDLYAPVTGNDFLYIIHNLHMQTNHAMMEGREVYSVKAAQETVNSIPKDYLNMPAPLGNYIQYIYMTPVLVHIRFGNWNELLAMQQPEPSQVYSTILYRFGRGMAFAQQGKLREAKQELDHLRFLMKDSSLSIPFAPFSAAIDGARVAENLLSGSITLGEKRFEEAIRLLEKAVKTEENMVYNEPRDWLLNPKHYLGNAHLKAGQWQQARKVFQNDLENNNENGWALFGLYQAYMIGSRKGEAEKMRARAKKAFANADTEQHGAVF
jgi:tetratricopeptide (TPR) repeat protein